MTVLGLFRTAKIPIVLTVTDFLEQTNDDILFVQLDLLFLEYVRDCHNRRTPTCNQVYRLSHRKRETTTTAEAEQPDTSVRRERTRTSKSTKPHLFRTKAVDHPAVPSEKRPDRDRLAPSYMRNLKAEVMLSLSVRMSKLTGVQ